MFQKSSAFNLNFRQTSFKVGFGFSYHSFIPELKLILQNFTKIQKMNPNNENKTGDALRTANVVFVQQD